MLGPIDVSAYAASMSCVDIGRFGCVFHFSKSNHGVVVTPVSTFEGRNANVQRP